MPDDDIFSRLSLSAPDAERFRASSRRSRDFGNLAVDIVFMESLLEARSPKIDAECFDGMKHSIDETRMLIAMIPAQTEHQLMTKVGFLAEFTPLVSANQNLAPMAIAAVRVDLFRLKITRTPAWFPERMKL
jgi:hypothetical protein